MNFSFGLKNIHEPSSFYISVGESIIAKRIYKNYVVTIFHRDTMVDLVELDMVDFNVIFGMD